MKKLVELDAAIDAVHRSYDTILDFRSDGETVANSVEDILSELPSAQPVLTYQTCSDALLKMWMDNVVTDGEYNRIMDRLNAWKGVQT